jgi:hypothetical protein
MAVPEPPPDRRRRRLSLGTALVLEDFRSVRRWLAVLGAVALLALGGAAWSLVKVYELQGDSADRDRVLRLERTLDARLAELQAALRRAGEEEDITRLQRELRRKANAGQLARLDGRLERLAEDVGAAADGSADATRALNRLSDRVDALAERVERRAD